MGSTFCGEVSENYKEEDIKQWLGESSASLHITYKKKDTPNTKKCEIYVTVGNGQKIKCAVKGIVNMKPQGEETFKLTKVIYVPQAVNNFLIVSRLVSKGSTIGDTQDKITINKTAST